MKRILLALAVVATVAVGIFFLTRDRSANATSYRFVSISRGDIESSVTATGSLSAVRTVQVGTQVSGQIAELYVDFNDRVRKGQLIARLDPTLLEEAVRQAQADLDRAAADLAQKEFVFQQTDQMHQSGAVTETEHKSALFALQMSRAGMKASEANLERARRNLQYASIHAPIDGIIIERNVDVGQTVAASLSAPQLFLIAEDLSSMQILASVDESDIGRIAPGQQARFTVQAFTDRTFEGKVRQVRMQSATTENVVNYTVVVDVDNSDGALLPGMTATVTFRVAGAENVLKVPNAALRLRPTEAMLAAAADDETGEVPEGTTRLWTLDAQGQPRALAVVAGLTDGQETEVSGPGLREGLRVIAAITTGGPAASEGVASPFQTAQPQGGRGRRGGF
ncbi:MAG TPA: efflux RND transporter periplasmic adaptor subunit [Gemmatimonadaceae bacterium]|nr:efflux RND transporter periplasmic adaptor subunit [Gemmatimonadaceae bacterium]